MGKVTDPFERAVRREETMRSRAAAVVTRDGMMRLVIMYYLALAAGWALVVAGHWMLLREPRWLVVLHTVVFSVVVVLALCAAGFARTVMWRRGDWFDEGA